MFPSDRLYISLPLFLSTEWISKRPFFDVMEKKASEMVYLHLFSW